MYGVLPDNRGVGEELTNTLFGEELAPEYLDAIGENQKSTVNEPEGVIHESVVGDILSKSGHL